MRYIYQKEHIYNCSNRLNREVNDMSEFTTLMTEIEKELAFMKSMSESPDFDEAHCLKTLREIRQRF